MPNPDIPAPIRHSVHLLAAAHILSHAAVSVRLYGERRSTIMTDNVVEDIDRAVNAIMAARTYLASATDGTEVAK